MPPAFVLSQDQTLRKINLFYRKIRFKHFYLCCFDYIEYSMSQNEFSRLHRTIQFSISNHFFVVSHNISFIVSLVKRTFEDFLRFFINLRFSVIRHCCECKNLIYHKNLLCQARFLIFSSFLSAYPALHELVMRRRTRHNISPEFILSNHFEQKICFFCKKAAQRASAWAQVYMRAM